MNSKYIVALDQGTTSSRAILYDTHGAELNVHSEPLSVKFPNDGWVEQDALEIWTTQLSALRKVTTGISAKEIACIGITNQRETIVCWDPTDGKPLAPAIVWQCRRSASLCAELRKSNHAAVIQKKTGLVLDPYFSATKIVWLLENISDLPRRMREGRAVFGTVDSWLLYQLSGGNSSAVFRTEPTNASRTMLYNLESGEWDDELLKLFKIDRKALAEICPSDSVFGMTKVLGEEIPVSGILGDQQASLFGNSCFDSNSVKCTFGTGAFLLANTGQSLTQSNSGLITTVAFELHSNSIGRSYALEGSVFIAGALIQWLRDKLGIIKSAAEVEALASSVTDSCGVVVVPAFVGLGAPYWDASARGSIFGLTRDASAAHIVRASLEAVAHQVVDVLDTGKFSKLQRLAIDGGMSRNKLFCQILANLTNLEIAPAPLTEMTAFGAARVAALGAELFNDLAQVDREFNVQGSSAVFKPELCAALLERHREDWQKAVSRSAGWIS